MSQNSGMIKWLKSLLRPKGASPQESATSTTALPDVEEDAHEEIPLYPPNDRGIPSEPVSRVLERQKDLVVRIRRAAGVAPDAFARYETPIANLASYVHLLPATDTQYFVGAGGLIRMSLEIGLHSLQLSHASVFPMIGSIEKRASILPKWELATFLAAICSQLYRPMTNMVVTDRDNNQWPQILHPLSEWLESVNAPRYFIRWTPGRDGAERQNCATYVINKIIPAEVLQYLNEDNNIIVTSMTAAISGGDLNPSENPIARIVAPITTRVIKEDMQQNSRHYGNYSLGIHLEPHLIDSMRRLIKNGKWSVNIKGARVWVGTDGVFVVWGAGAKEIVSLLTADSFVGLPQDPDTLADILIDAQVLVRNADLGRYWTIILPESGTLIDNAVRLSNDSLIFPNKQDLSALRTVALCVSSAGGTAPVAPVPDEKKPKKPRKKKEGEAASPAGEAEQAATQVTSADEQVEALSQAAPQGGGGETAGSDEMPAAGENKQHISEDAAEDEEGDDAPQIPAWALAPSESAPIEPPPESSSSPDRQEVVGNEVLSPQAAVTPPVSTVEPVQKVVEQTTAERPVEKAASPGMKLDEVSEKFLGMLSRESQWLVKQIVKAQQKGTLTGVVVNLENGLGISDAELSAHGMPTPDFLNDLASRNWLWVDKAKPLRKVHRVDVNGKTESLVIIQPNVARGLGFDWVPPVENGDE